MKYLLALCLIALWTTIAAANCVNLTVSAWSADERTYMEQTATTAAGEPVDVTWIVGQVGTQARFCARTADISGFSSATLRTAAAALHQAQVDAAAAHANSEAEATTELNASAVCLTATLTQIETLLDTHHDAMQASINSMTNIATAQTALSLMNTRRTAIDKGIAKCLRAWIQYQQLQGD